MLDQRLGDAGVDVVVGHVVADAVGAPAEGEFTQVARTDDKGVSQIRDAEQVRGPLSGLDIFEGDVVNRLSLRIGVADVLEHLHAARPDVDLICLHAQRLHQAQGVAVGFFGCRKTGHRVGQDMGAGRFKRSIVRAATIRACVESSPPETPITTLSIPEDFRRWDSP